MRLPLLNWLKRAGWCLALLLPLAAHAQAPANDNPSGAIALPLATSCTPSSGTNVGATPTVANGYANPGCGIATTPLDVWFRFTTDATGPGSTAAAITVAGTAAGQVRLFSSAGGATGPFTALGCASGGSNNAQAARLVVVGLTPATTYYVSVAGYGSTDTQGAFTICATVPVANDAAVESVLTLAQLPIPPGAPHVVRAVVSNQGSSVQTNLPVTLTVTGANAFTNTLIVATLAPGASATVSFAAFTPTATGTNTLAVTTPADDTNTNNSRSVLQEVNTTTYSYASPGVATGAFQLGLDAIDRAFACRYRVNSPVSVVQVRSYVVNFGGLPAGQAGSSIGKTVYGVLLDFATGTLLARSPDYVLTAADINTYVTLPLTTSVALPAGTDVLVGMVALYPAGPTANYAPFGTQVDEPGRTDAFYNVSAISLVSPQPVNSNTGGYKRLMLEAVTAPAIACPGPTTLTATGITPTGATLAFTPPVGASGSYSLTYFANGVSATTVAVTTSPVTLSGLTPGTTYTVSLSASCGGGQASYPTFTTFTTPLPAQDAAVEAVQALTQLPIPAGAPHVVRAVVSNRGTAALANLPVTLTVTGANAFTNTQTLATLAPGATTTVSFAGFTPAATGANTLTVTVPADGLNTNNNRSATQVVNTTTFSYTDPGVGAQVGLGFGPTSVNNAGVVRLQTSTSLRVTQVRAYLRTAAAAPAPSATVGKTVYGVLLDAAGAVLARSPDYVVVASDLNTYVTFTLTTPPILPAGSDFYVGAAQTYQLGQNTGYSPLGGQANGPGQPNTFYSASTNQVVAPTDLITSGPYKLMIEAVTQVVLATHNEVLAATVVLYPNPAHQAFTLVVPAGSLGSASATLMNALGQVVQTRQLHLPAAGGTTEFDVRGLAAGVYSLQLQTGETRVVKRVVIN
ncbi:CARDB domain-containing protein [Hymenobacter norwichensis]|uniref:CARDB domain-containing protein n=1 Tax=Hymenobacter norwichensis TaxID=223903 RepID=UPI0003B50898|nr:CARDB domain-containing protein [Hymenobacter norwichensis]